MRHNQYACFSQKYKNIHFVQTKPIQFFPDAATFSVYFFHPFLPTGRQKLRMKIRSFCLGNNSGMAVKSQEKRSNTRSGPHRGPRKPPVRRGIVSQGVRAAPAAGDIQKADLTFLRSWDGRLRHWGNRRSYSRSRLYRHAGLLPSAR